MRVEAIFNTLHETITAYISHAAQCSNVDFNSTNKIKSYKIDRSADMPWIFTAWGELIFAARILSLLNTTWLNSC